MIKRFLARPRPIKQQILIGLAVGVVSAAIGASIVLSILNYFIPPRPTGVSTNTASKPKTPANAQQPTVPADTPAATAESANTAQTSATAAKKPASQPAPAPTYTPPAFAITSVSFSGATSFCSSYYGVMQISSMTLVSNSTAGGTVTYLTSITNGADQGAPYATTINFPAGTMYHTVYGPFSPGFLYTTGEAKYGQTYTVAITSPNTGPSASYTMNKQCN